MPVASAPLCSALERSAESRAHRALLYHPSALAGQGPEVRETQQVEGPRTSDVIVAGGTPIGPSKFDQPSLVRVERQAVLPEALREYFHDATSVLLAREDDDHVVRVPDKVRVAAQPRLHVPREPH